ncbi:hypothetical protein [Massilia horti]|uniref:Uncharacterized protein n=1 Tax=Massilia horti TaxID=2562153 RepID=A0A4Y9STE7_9BURK|nr:hypothetical protein [Massilia horti]TFW28504.1 hypothetical protein E4O92_21075 [Massilia horti]
MQKTTQAPTSSSPADPGFKLPSEAAKPNDPLPQTTPPTAHEPIEVASPPSLALNPATDTSARDLAIGATAFLVLLVIYFFARNAYVHHLVVRRVSPSSAGSAGWLLFVGLGFMSAAAVLAMINAGKFLTFAVTAPLVAVGIVALMAALFIGRR